MNLYKTNVAIITPLYNRGHLITETIESVIAQTYPYWELIIVDDGSSDDGPEIVKDFAEKDSRIKLLHRSEAPKGPSSCRNIGAKSTDAEYLIFLDSDDLLSTTCLEQRVNCIKELAKNIDFCVFPLQLFNKVIGDLDIIFNSYFESKFEYLLAFLEDKTPWQTTCSIWKKSSFMKVGGFDTSYLRLTDPVLHTNAIFQGLNYHIARNAQPDVYYRNSFEENVKTFNFWDESIRFRMKFIKEVYPKITNANFNNSEKKKAFNSLHFFIKNLFKTALISRIETYQSEAKDLYFFAKEKGLLNKRTTLLLNILFISSKYKYLQLFKLKGVIYKLL
jgi:glycosyltransferase involved in cell wall biosynthesis